MELEAIYSSPMERAQETARPLSVEKKLKIGIREEFTEIDFGVWTGKSFGELAQLWQWRQFNECRSLARILGGESMLEVVQRMAQGIEMIQREHSNGRVAVFSHCDPI
jgi:broad specificity phosphatase PhoE